MNTKRLWEIDFVRGLAVIGMVIYHFAFDLQYFHLTDIVNSDSFKVLALFTAATFIFLVGISGSLRFQKLHSQTISKVTNLFVRRALSIFVCGLLISAITYFIDPHQFVIFGILHFIGLSLILLIPFLYFNSFFILTVIITMFLLTPIISAHHTPNYLLIWLGSSPSRFVSFDYVPLFPWFSVTLLGLLFSRFYSNHRPKILDTFLKYQNNIVNRLGRHSLALYLFHQPLIFALIYLYVFFKGSFFHI